MEKFPKYDFNEENLLRSWKDENLFEGTIEKHKDNSPYVFYEGPPSANGKPGIHHVMARTIKDAVCRYQTMKGQPVYRKAGWDTHGLPVELGVEKAMGLKKEDIGNKISIKDFNKNCREDVMKFKAIWEDLTDKMGYWVDMDHPYITYDNKYIESIWWALATLYEKGLLYKGHTIQPYSPMAGTGLSSHELNQPGCYRQVKDTTVIAQFKLKAESKAAPQFKDAWADVYCLAWTTTPWTLPSNTGLAVGKKISYQLINTYNRYTGDKVSLVIAKDRVTSYFKKEGLDADINAYNAGDKVLPYQIAGEFAGKDLEGMRYEQLLPYSQPENADPFKVVSDDFVTTEDGTGIVHIAPSFGADDQRVGIKNNLGSLTLVDLKGRFVDEVTDFAGEAVKAEYEPETITNAKDYLSVDVRISIKLKKENKAFLVEKYEHSYPHCWRTDKPIVYYPLDSWFIKTTAHKDRLIALNKTINWHPASTGEGRFGNWLENLVDWNLSRSRYWGVPLPIWTNADGSERKVIGSLKQLKEELNLAVEKGVMKDNPFATFDPEDMSPENYAKIDIHRPYVDDVYLADSKGEKMTRESDIIDVWFDSGSMPFAQWHYPFENKATFDKNFPADFIAEGVDQTRGWFFTLHAIATMLFDSVAFKNVISNGLVLDKGGHKMSKRLGNVVDPFELMSKYGADPVRWYMVWVSNPWDNLKFDESGVLEVKRRFFNTLSNTYSFFALYANVDNFDSNEAPLPLDKRTELDRWILSELHTLIKKTTECYDNYDLTGACRAILNFTTDHLSNWYVRLNRRRFWKGEKNADKQAAYQTLHECLLTLCKLSAPIAPFETDYLYRSLSQGNKQAQSSVHLDLMPQPKLEYVDEALMYKMRMAQDICSLTLSVREKEKIKVRQPLAKLLIPVVDERMQQMITEVEPIILQETNIKEIEYVGADSDIFTRKIKANFKTLGPKLGPKMKAVAGSIVQLSQDKIIELQNQGHLDLDVDGDKVTITADDVEVFFEEQHGLSFATNGKLTVTLDVTISETLLREGLARELTKHIQNMRKDKGLDITDRITLKVKKSEFIDGAIESFGDYIKTETLATSLDTVDASSDGFEQVKIDRNTVEVYLEKN